MNNQSIIVRLALPSDKIYSSAITQEMEESAKARGTGIAKRSTEYIEKKMDEGKAVIALTEEGKWVGFCYIEAWEHEKYVANSGLIVSPSFRKSGVAKSIKSRIFQLSREKYPEAKIFGLTTGLAVMKINSDLGYEPITYSELTTDEEFWKGCRSCINYEILMSKNRKNCICTAMLFDPAEVKLKNETVPVLVNQAQTDERRHFKGNFKLFERWIRFKQFVLLRPYRKNENRKDNLVEKKNSFLGIFFW